MSWLLSQSRQSSANVMPKPACLTSACASHRIGPSIIQKHTCNFWHDFTWKSWSQKSPEKCPRWWLQRCLIDRYCGQAETSGAAWQKSRNFFYPALPRCLSSELKRMSTFSLGSLLTSLTISVLWLGCRTCIYTDIKLTILLLLTGHLKIS